MPKPGSGLQWRTSYTDGNSLPASAFGGSGGAEMCFKLDVLDPSAYTMQKQAGGGYLLQPRVAPAAAAPPAPRAAPAAAAQPAGGEAGAAAEAAAAAPGKRNRRKRKREAAAAAAAAAAPAPASAAPAPAAAEAADGAGGGEEGGAGAGPDRKRKRKRTPPAAGAATPSAASAAGEGGEGEGGAGAARRAQAPPQRAPPPPQPQPQQQQQQQPRASALGPKDSAPALPSQDVAATWAPFGPLRPELLANLARLRYGAPTAVQRSVLPEAITNFKDIVATAATGSGKTAAYALPLLQRLLDRREALGMAVAAPAQGAPPLPRWAALPALVLVPTRELALQVRDHVNALAAGTAVRAVAVVGGLAAQKQERLLRARPDILVATPGRLAELMGSPHCAPFLSMDLSTLQLLVLDEADRMVDKGSFESLRVIFAALRGAKGASASASDKRGGGGGRGGEVDEIAEAIVRGVQEESARAAGRQGGGGEGGEGSGEEGEGEDEGGKAAGSSAAPATIPWRPSFKRQTFLFSATLGVATSAARAKDAALALVQAKAYAEGAGDEQGKLSGKGLKRALASVEGVSAVEALVAMCGCSGKPFVVRVGGGEGEGGGSGGAAAPAGASASGDGGGGTAAAAAFVGKAAARAAADRQPAPPAAGSGEGSGEGSGGGSGSGSGSGSGAYHEDATTAVHSTHAGERVSARALALPPGLRLGRVTCADMGEKECALYAFLQRYPGRTLVFLNSISGLKRLALLLTALRCPAFTLHAHMEQRARIKHLERFVAAAGSSSSSGGAGAGSSGTGSGTSVLLATDVAARGLDLPAVDAVIHFGLPLTAETFVHRSGRTARGPGGRGIALALVGPKDNAAYGRLCGALGMRSGLAEFPGEPGIARAVAARVAAARALAEVQGSLAADSAAQGWLVRQAEEMGVGLDEETVREVGGLGEVHLARQAAAAAAAAAEAAGGEAAAAAGGGKRRKGGKREAVAEGAGEGEGEGEGGGGGGAQHAHTSEEDMALSRERRLKITHLKRVLAGLLAAPLIPTGTSRRYITGNPLLAQPMHPLQSTIRLAPAVVAGEGGGEGGGAGGAGGAAAPAPAPVARSGSALVGLKVLPPLGFAAPVPQGKGGGKHRAPAAAQPDIFRRQGPLQALMAGGRHAHVPAAKIAARRAVSEHKRSGKGRK